MKSLWKARRRTERSLGEAIQDHITQGIGVCTTLPPKLREPGRLAVSKEKGFRLELRKLLLLNYLISVSIIFELTTFGLGA